MNRVCKDGERERERAGVLCGVIGCEYVRDERCVKWGRVLGRPAV